MSATSFRSDIQGLRAIAVLAVMAFHYNPAWLPGGFVGVDVFLVISGFLITSILIKKKAKADYSLPATLKYFYISRFKRIGPAYFVMLVLVALVAAVLFLPKDFGTFKDGLENAARFTSNHYFANFGNYFAPVNHEQPLLHTWSLAVEMQFYILAPFLVLLLPIKALKAVFVMLIFSLTMLAEYRMRGQGVEQATYYSLYARLPEFFAGGLAAMYSTSAPRKSVSWLGYLGIASIALALVAQPLLGVFPGAAALLPVVGSLLLLIAPAQGILGKILSTRILVWVGALSYSFYLWHWPVMAFLRYYTGDEVINFGFSLLFIVVTLLLSVASYYGVERAFQIKRTRKHQVTVWAVLIACVFGASQAMAKVNAVFSLEQLPIEYRRYADPATICHGRIVGECLRGDLTSDNEVLVLGDSHAAMLNHFFEYLGKELGFKARIITASSCVTIPGFDYQWIAEWAHQPCVEQIEAAMPYIKASKVIVLAGAWSTQIKSERFITDLEVFVNNNVGKDIKILSQVPRFNLDTSRMRRFDKIGIPSEIQLDLSYEYANKVLAKLALEYDHLEFKSLNDLEVFEKAPYYGGSIIYMDEHHINEIGASAYASDALPYFKNLKASIDKL